MSSFPKTQFFEGVSVHTKTQSRCFRDGLVWMARLNFSRLQNNRNFANASDGQNSNERSGASVKRRGRMGRERTADCIIYCIYCFKSKIILVQARFFRHFTVKETRLPLPAERLSCSYSVDCLFYFI